MLAQQTKYLEERVPYSVHGSVQELARIYFRLPEACLAIGPATITNLGMEKSGHGIAKNEE